ncbi:Cullin repeat-like-containing domain protein [Limtongia smithiae]|uniref:Cullin repeat-like-containing domain protein n=1 Tax=Limtongia smithiae TaxID=1125753 RepID=UPI0034CF44D3
MSATYLAVPASEAVTTRSKRRPSASPSASAVSMHLMPGGPGEPGSGGAGGNRQSVIPSMSTSKAPHAFSGGYAAGSTAASAAQQSSSSDVPGDKVGKLLKRYSTRPTVSPWHKKSKDKDKKGKSSAAAAAMQVPPDSLASISETTYPPLPQARSMPEVQALTQGQRPQQQQQQQQRQLALPMRTPSTRSAPSPQAMKQPPTPMLSLELPLLPGLDEKKYPVPVRDFEAANFDPSQHIQRNLGDYADYQLRDYLEQLRVTRDMIGTDMQRNLFNNYSQFVRISSEIATLEQEIRSTRNMMNELSTLVSGMRPGAAGDKDGAHGDGVTGAGGTATAGAAAEGRDSVETAPMPILARQATRRDLGAPEKTVVADDTSVVNIASNDSDDDVDARECKSTDEKLQEQLLELDVLIAHRQTDAAINLILALQASSLASKTSSSSYDAITEPEADPSLQARADEVYDILAYPLSSETTPRGVIIKTLRALSSLGYASAVREAYLSARTTTIDRRVRAVRQHDPLTGVNGLPVVTIGTDEEDDDEIVAYVSEVATITFTLVRATVDVYRAVFPGASDASMIVDWTRSRVDGYVSVFEQAMRRFRQPDGSDNGNGNGYANGAKRDEGGFLRAVTVSRKQADQLREIGLAMDFILQGVYDDEKALLSRPRSSNGENGSVALANGGPPSPSSSGTPPPPLPERRRNRSPLKLPRVTRRNRDA